MPELLGVRYGPGVSELIARARAAWTPRELVLDDIDRAPPDVPRDVRGAFTSSVPGVYLNPRRPDTDEHTLAHELGHSLVQARGWITLTFRLEITRETIRGWGDMLDNRLQHIAMEPLLRDAGFDTKPGHRHRIERDLAAVAADLDGEWDAADPQFYHSRAVKLAEAYFCAPLDDFRYFRDEVGRRAPLAVELGRDLIEAVRARRWDRLSDVRAAVVAWARLLSHDARRRMPAGTPTPLEWAAVTPVLLRPGDADGPARRRLRLVAAAVQPEDPKKHLYRCIWEPDGSTCAVFSVTANQEVTPEAVLHTFERRLNLPLAEFAKEIDLRIAEEAPGAT